LMQPVFPTTNPLRRAGLMSLSADAKYPSRRAYVVKMRGDAGPEALVGRLENLVTGQQREFSSGRELLESLAADLEATRREHAPQSHPSERPDSPPRTHPECDGAAL
jgi:hypothetical protein